MNLEDRIRQLEEEVSDLRKEIPRKPPSRMATEAEMEEHRERVRKILNPTWEELEERNRPETRWDD